MDNLVIIYVIAGIHEKRCLWRPMVKSVEDTATGPIEPFLDASDGDLWCELLDLGCDLLRLRLPFPLWNLMLWPCIHQAKSCIPFILMHHPVYVSASLVELGTKLELGMLLLMMFLFSFSFDSVSDREASLVKF